MGLLPLEFTDCLQDSPYFRDSLHSHEKELERTSSSIKDLIKEVKNLLQAAKSLSKAQRNLSSHLINFKFDCIGSQQTDDELVIAGSLKEFGKLISAIEDERDRMLERSYDNFILPLETFRKEQIGAVKERKKKFDKQTAKFCTSQERYLGLSTKKPDNMLQEADATLEMEQRDFARAALEYVCLIQEVQERKKFEFVETLQAFMYGWLTFYHQGHEVAKDFKPYMLDLQIRVQNTRENFNSSRDDIQSLMRKMLEVRQTKPMDPGTFNKMYTRTGYLFLMEKKALSTTWQKCYCQYLRDNRLFCMIPYNQTAGKITTTESFKIKACISRSQETTDKRFCFDIIPEDRHNTVFTFQAQSEEDRQLWVEALDGREPSFSVMGGPGRPSNADQTFLDSAGFAFVTNCCRALERRGLEDQGLYRVVGVASKVNKLLNLGLAGKKLDLDDVVEWETKTITSAIKTFLRNLPEPLMSFSQHAKFIDAAKHETYASRLGEVHRLVHLLPDANKSMLEILLTHLYNVVQKSDKNLMTVSNLGVCFGPTLLRAEEETVAAIMDIKFANVVVEILIQNWETILKTVPGDPSATSVRDPASPTLGPGPPPKPSHSQQLNNSNNNSHSSSSGLVSSPASPNTASVALQTSPSTRPPPYVPPPTPPTNSPPAPGQHQQHPTLATAVIFEGPKLHTQPSAVATNGPTPYATWERTLKGGGPAPAAGHPTLHHTSSSGSVAAGPPAQQQQQHPGPVNSILPHRSIGLGHSALTASTSSLASTNSTAASTASGHLHHTPHIHNKQQALGTPSPPWYRQNQMPMRSGQVSQQAKPSSSNHYPLSGGTDSKTSADSSAGTATASSATPGVGGSSSGSGASTESLTSCSSRDTRTEDAGGGHLTAAATAPVAPQRSNNMLGQGGRGVQGMQLVELRRVRTLYACVGEHETELSFEPNQIITGVRPSLEPGWLEGTLDGKVGLVPENYVEYI